MKLKRHHWILIILAVVGVFSIAGIVEQRRMAETAEARIWFFDVGQGDGAMIRDRDGHEMLIDGGPDGSLLEGLASAMPWWDRDIDVMLVTHLDADHYAGFFGVLRRYHVKEVWWSGVAPTTATARSFVAAVESQGIPQHFAKAGDEIPFAGGGAFRVLWPREDVHGRLVPPTTSNAKGGGTNDLGIVGRFDCGTERALFTADVSSHVEAQLIDDAASVRADVLKVGHHGSAYSSSETFLDAVHPRDAVISVGAGNRYGHPTARVLSALLARGIAVHRTDREGTIRYACAGGKLHLVR